MYTFPKPEGAMQTLNYNVHNGLGPSTLSSPGKIKEKKSFTQYRKINERFSQTKSPTLYTNIFGETSMSVMNAANAIRSWEDRKAVAEHIHTYVEKKSLLHEFVRKISSEIEFKFIKASILFLQILDFESSVVSLGQQENHFHGMQRKIKSLRWFSQS